jgi:hypothetical protein
MFHKKVHVNKHAPNSEISKSYYIRYTDMLFFIVDLSKPPKSEENVCTMQETSLCTTVKLWWSTQTYN